MRAGLGDCSTNTVLGITSEVCHAGTALPTALVANVWPR